MIPAGEITKTPKDDLNDWLCENCGRPVHRIYAGGPWVHSDPVISGCIYPKGSHQNNFAKCKHCGRQLVKIATVWAHVETHRENLHHDPEPEIEASNDLP